MVLVGKTAHVGAASAMMISATRRLMRSAIKPIDIIVLFAQKGFDIGIQLGDLGNENSDVGEHCSIMSL